MTAEAFTCPRCGRTSHHPDDVAAGYCGACHDWTGLDERAWVRVGVVAMGCGHVGYAITGGGLTELTPPEAARVLRAAAKQMEDQA